MILSARNLLWLGLLASSAAGEAQPNSPPACDTPEHHQFDFWVGRWDVYRSDTNQLVAESLIEKLYGGCAVRENWTPTGGTGGGSLNSYRPGEGVWRQTWTDSSNNWNEYAGGLVGGDIVLNGTSVNAAGAKIPVRITYKRGTDGSVLQIGEQSLDDGKTWQLRYHFTYRPAVKK
jgi:hypothetical protein